MSDNIYENIIKNNVDYNGVNPSNHNLYLSISNSACDPHTKIDNSIDISNEIKCSWHKASFENVQAYRSALDCKLDSFSDLNDSEAMFCTDKECTNDLHRMQINKLCSTLIEYCIIASRETVPLARPNAKKIAGWCDNVKESRDTSLFWHWVWLKAGKPMTGHVYCIMKRTRHRYHCAVRCAKRKSIETTSTKLAESISNSKDF